MPQSYKISQAQRTCARLFYQFCMFCSWQDQGPSFNSNPPLFLIKFLTYSIIILYRIPTYISCFFIFFMVFRVDVAEATIPVLRLSFMMNLTAWLAGACAWVFEHYKINYLFLLDISPDLEVSAMSLLNYASLQTGVWIVLSFCFIADMKFGAVLQSIPCIHGFSLAHIYSSSVLIMQFLITSSWMTASTRRLFSRLFIRILCFSCLGEVSFAENVLADVLTSLGRPLKDVAYTGCYFRHWHTDQDREVRRICKNSAWTGCTVQILLLLPLFFRIAQCYRRMRDTPEKVRHSLNCGKYVFAVVVSLLTSMRKPPRGLTSFQLNVIQTLGAALSCSSCFMCFIMFDCLCSSGP